GASWPDSADQQCNAGNTVVQFCNSQGTAWYDLEDCTSQGMVCVETSATTAECQSQSGCTDGEKRCNPDPNYPDDLQTCINGQWGGDVSCFLGCTDNGNNDVYCDECDALHPCMNVGYECVNGKCVEDTSCIDDGTYPYCDGDVSVKCTNNEIEREVCEEECQNGRCVYVTHSCFSSENGDRRCNSGDAEECKLFGSSTTIYMWQMVDECSARGEECVNGYCVVDIGPSCDGSNLGERICTNDDKIDECVQGGSYTYFWNTVDDCAARNMICTDTTSPVSCIIPPCTEGDERCDVRSEYDEILQTCNSNNEWEDTTNCWNSGNVCEQTGNSAECVRCRLEETRCTGWYWDVETCEQTNNRREWVSGQCSAGEKCLTNLCEDDSGTPNCIPGMLACGEGSDGNTAYRCDNDGNWVDAVMCNTPQFVCDNGECTDNPSEGPCFTGEVECDGGSTGLYVMQCRGGGSKGYWVAVDYCEGDTYCSWDGEDFAQCIPGR
ncbi:MAG: hypothetical protein ABIH83_03140, partial [Candidatus Micrarchaeota archaeon]